MLNRAHVLRGKPTCYVHALEIINDVVRVKRMMLDVRVVFIEGLSVLPDPFTSREYFLFRWVLTEWLNEGKSLVMLNDAPLPKAYGSRLLALIEDSKIHLTTNV